MNGMVILIALGIGIMALFLILAFRPTFRCGSQQSGLRIAEEGPEPSVIYDHIQFSGVLSAVLVVVAVTVLGIVGALIATGSVLPDEDLEELHEYVPVHHLNTGHAPQPQPQPPMAAPEVEVAQPHMAP